MMKFKHLNEFDREKYCQASCDLESGNYLHYYRNVDELNSIQEVVEAENAIDPTDRQLEILEWVKVCSDYDYARENGYLDENGHCII